MHNILASGGSDSCFSRSDFLADVDSAVIYKTLSGIQMDSFEKYFEYHYRYNYHTRCSLFITGKTYDDFVSTANSYLSLTPILTFIFEHKVTATTLQIYQRIRKEHCLMLL